MDRVATENEALLEHYKETVRIQLRVLCENDVERINYLDSAIKTVSKVIDKDLKDEMGASMRPILYKRLDFIKELRNNLDPIVTQDKLF